MNAPEVRAQRRESFERMLATRGWTLDFVSPTCVFVKDAEGNTLAITQTLSRVAIEVMDDESTRLAEAPVEVA